MTWPACILVKVLKCKDGDRMFEYCVQSWDKGSVMCHRGSQEIALVDSLFLVKLHILAPEQPF